MTPVEVPLPASAPHVPLTVALVRARLGELLEALAQAQASQAASRPGPGGSPLPLGIYPDDAAEFSRYARDLTDADARLIAAATGPLFGLIGAHLGTQPKEFFSSLPDQPGQPAGLLPMLALAVTAPEVRAYGEQLGLPPALAASGLGDLGQQLHVHRLVYGEFGLHTQWWLTAAWTGTLWWLGRLQFNLVTYDDRFWLSVHIPQTGPLTGVDESLARARAFARDHLPVDIAGFHCDSWLLDPQLGAALGGRGNIAAFQRLWQLRLETRVADSEAIFFTFRTREEVALEDLAQTTSLERAVVGLLHTGGHWYSPTALIPWG